MKVFSAIFCSHTYIIIGPEQSTKVFHYTVCDYDHNKYSEFSNFCAFQYDYFNIFTALTVGFYHLGCYIEYLLKLHDGARVFPVHAVRCAVIIV